MNSLTYYRNLAQYLSTLRAQCHLLSLSSEEEVYLKQAISNTYTLVLQQIQELQANES